MLARKLLILGGHAAVAAVIHGHHGLGLRGDTPLGVSQVERQGVGVDVAADGHAAGTRDGLHRGHKSEGGHEHFVAGVGHGLHGQMESRRTAVDADAATAASDIVLQCTLKLAHGLTHAQIADVFDDVGDSIGFSLTHNGF